MLTQIPPDTGLETAAEERRTLAAERAVRRARFARHLVARELGCSAGSSAAPARAVLQGRPVERFGRDITTTATSPLAPQYDTAARKNYSAVLIGPES